MNPKQLHCFITAAQEGSFSKAAKKLYLLLMCDKEVVEV